MKTSIAPVCADCAELQKHLASELVLSDELTMRLAGVLSELAEATLELDLRAPGRLDVLPMRPEVAKALTAYLEGRAHHERHKP